MDYLEVLKKLISFDTTVPPGRNYGPLISYLEPLFREAGFDTRLIEIPPEHAEGGEGRVNLIAHRRQAGHPRLIFYGHIDVVPAQGWDAFTPRVEGGKVYGRGAADMKGSLVGLLAALDSIRGRASKYDISVIVTTDEESSQASQLRYLRQYIEPVRDALVFNLDSSFGYVSITGLGALHVDIRVKGRSVHSAMSHLGENAVEDAARLMNALLELKKRVIARKSLVEAAPGTSLTRMEARLNINMIHGGLKVNIVPDECLISVDRRLIPEENMEDARQELIDTLTAVPGVRWELARVVTIPTVPPAESPVIDELAGIIRQVTGKSGKYGEMGSGDLPYIVTGEWGGVEFGLGVIRPECNIHGRDEFVYQKDITDLAEIIRRFLLS